MKNFVLVEAVNIDQTVFDTDQLSVIRGSSFILKEAIDHLKCQLSDSLMPISTGASSGLFLVAGGKDPTSVREQIIKKLEQSPYHHFTFVVEHCRANDLLQAREQLLAQLRFSQLAGLTTAPDRFSGRNPRRDHPCELDGRRIAAGSTQRRVQIRDEDKNRQLSWSVCERLDLGKDRRQDYYFNAGLPEESAKILHGYSFTDDLESLSENQNYPLLSKKIAVVYIDGNRFGSIQRDNLEEAQSDGKDLVEAQREFDQQIQRKRMEFLRGLLMEMIEDGNSHFPDALTVTNEGESAIRFETLMWGGDEMVFVLPAWLGFEFIQYFFERTAHWKAPAHGKAAGERALTHGVGVVFCHANSPIRVIRELAQSIADTIKRELGKKREINFWDYIVLESIDYPMSKDIGRFMEKRYGDWSTSRKRHLVPGKNWTRLKVSLSTLIENQSFSRRQLYRILDDAGPHQQGESVTWETLADISTQLNKNVMSQVVSERRMLQLIDSDHRDHVVELVTRLGEDIFGVNMDNPTERAWLWLHLTELWDYLIPQKQELGT